jgi:carbamoylphosphate synthase large subunit
MWPWLLSLLRLKTIRVVVFGQHSPDWMEALGPQSEVWRAIPEVRQVLQIPDSNPIPPTFWPGRQTVVLPLLEPHIARRPPHLKALAPDARALSTFSDKAAFAHYVQSQNLEAFCPKSYPSLEEAVYPCVLKRTDLNAGYGVVIVSSREEALAHLDGDMFSGKNVVWQTLVPKRQEYSAHCICQDGVILWHRVFIFETGDLPVIRGAHHPLPSTPTSSWEGLIPTLEAFLRPLHFRGPCNIDFTLGPEGRLCVFEINPRLGGTLMLPENRTALGEALACILRHAY